MSFDLSCPACGSELEPRLAYIWACPVCSQAYEVCGTYLVEAGRSAPTRPERDLSTTAPG